jgi:hypothetical protein
MEDSTRPIRIVGEGTGTSSTCPRRAERQVGTVWIRDREAGPRSGVRPLRHHFVRVQHEFLGCAFIEILVTLRRVIE